MMSRHDDEALTGTAAFDALERQFAMALCAAACVLACGAGLATYALLF